MSALDILNSLRPQTGGTRNLALSVLKKHVKESDPEDHYFEVVDGDGKRWHLEIRTDHQPLKDVKVFEGGMVIAEGCYEVKDAEHPTLSSRYVTSAFKRAGEGEVITAVATIVGRRREVDGRRETAPIVKVLLEKPAPIKDLDELIARTAQAFVNTTNDFPGMGWPVASFQLWVRENDTGQVSHRSYDLRPATEGEEGKKRVSASVEVQTASLRDQAQKDGSNLSLLTKLAAMLEAPEYANKYSWGVQFIPAIQLNPGRDTAKSMLQDPVFTGVQVAPPVEDGDGNKSGVTLSATRFFPREEYTYKTADEQEKTALIFKYAPVMLVVSYGKGPDGITVDKSKSFVSKIRTIEPESSCPTASQRTWVGLERVFDGLNPDATQTTGLPTDARANGPAPAPDLDAYEPDDMPPLGDFSDADLESLEALESSMSGAEGPR